MAEEDISLRVTLKNRREVAKGLGDINQDLEKTDRTASRASRGLAGLGKVGKTALKGLAVGVGVVSTAVVGFGLASLKSASQAQQSLGATETVFGKYASTVIKRSNEAARAVGLSANEYRGLANVMGASLAGAGVPMKQTTKLTGDLTSRAADLAATFGGTTAEAVEAISSLMRGEADPIERYGISIKESDVSARLAAKGLAGLTGEAQKQAAMQARVELLMQKSAKSAGAFARESGTLEHQQQVLGAQWENLKARLGKGLLPVATRFFAFLNDKGIPALEALGAWMTSTGNPALQAFARRLAPVIDWLKDLTRAVLSGGDQMGKFGDTVTGVWEGIRSIISDYVTILITLWRKFGDDIISYFRSTFDNVLQLLNGAKDVIVGVFKLIRSIVTGDWKGMWDGIKQILSGVWNILAAIVKQGITWIRTALTIGGKAIGAAFRLIWDGVKKGASAAWDGVRGIVSSGVDKVISVVKSMPGKIISGAKAGFKSAGKTLIEAFVNGLKGTGGLVADIAGNVWSAIKGFMNDAIGKIESAISFSVDWPGPGSFSYSPSIPRLEKGGPALAGRPYIVGEKRPELFVPDTNGTVVPRVPELSYPRIGDTGGWEKAWDADTDLVAGYDDGGDTVIQLVVDGKVLTAVVLEEIESKGARQ